MGRAWMLRWPGFLERRRGIWGSAPLTQRWLGLLPVRFRAVPKSGSAKPRQRQHLDDTAPELNRFTLLHASHMS